MFTTQLYQYFSVSFLIETVRDKPEVCFPKFSKTAVLYAAHFQTVVNV